MSTADLLLRNRVVSRAKVVDYLLDCDRIEGSDKAKFFLSFGFSAKDDRTLAKALYDHPDRAFSIETWSDRWGTRYDVVGPIHSPDGRNPTVLTGRIDDGDGPVRLVTAFPA